MPGTPAEICDEDTDGDGFPDSEDNCPGAANDQSDVNGDGIGDPCQPGDSDSDGWDDDEEAVALLEMLLVEEARAAPLFLESKTCFLAGN